MPSLSRLEPAADIWTKPQGLRRSPVLKSPAACHWKVLWASEGFNWLKLVRLVVAYRHSPHSIHPRCQMSGLHDPRAISNVRLFAYSLIYIFFLFLMMSKTVAEILLQPQVCIVMSAAETNCHWLKASFGDFEIYTTSLHCIQVTHSPELPVVSGSTALMQSPLYTWSCATGFQTLILQKYTFSLLVGLLMLHTVIIIFW